VTLGAETAMVMPPATVFSLSGGALQVYALTRAVALGARRRRWVHMFAVRGT
jgi:hypothetical protein